MPSGAWGRHCFSVEMTGGKQGEVVAAAAAIASVANDFRVFSLVGGKGHLLLICEFLCYIPIVTEKKVTAWEGNVLEQKQKLF